MVIDIQTGKTIQKISFFTKEPLGFAGSMNFYVYADGDSVNRIDLDGLDDKRVRYLINNYEKQYNNTEDAWRATKYDRFYNPMSKNPNDVDLRDAEHYLFAKDTVSSLGKWYSPVMLLNVYLYFTYKLFLEKSIEGIQQTPATWSQIKWGQQGVCDAMFY